MLVTGGRGKVGSWTGAPELRPLDREDAAGISSAKARALFGWSPTRSWRDSV